MIYYAIRQKSTGHYMPNYGSRKGRGGWTNDEPQPLTQVSPRLFTKKHVATAALREWLKGRTYVVHRGFSEDADEDWRTKPVAGRTADDMEVVPVWLEDFEDRAMLLEDQQP